MTPSNYERLENLAHKLWQNLTQFTSTCTLTLQQFLYQRYPMI
jgi:hypothetical protein